MSFDLLSYVLDTHLKRGEKLSNDHHLVVRWIQWWGRLLDRSGKPNRIVRVNWESLGDSPVHVLFKSHLWESFLHVPWEDRKSKWAVIRASIALLLGWIYKLGPYPQ